MVAFSSWESRHTRRPSNLCEDAVVRAIARDATTVSGLPLEPPGLARESKCGARRQQRHAVVPSEPDKEQTDASRKRCMNRGAVSREMASDRLAEANWKVFVTSVERVAKPCGERDHR